jgi:hypothetical protein
MRRFPPPWTVEALDGGFKIVDANKQTLAYAYGHADPRDAQIAKALTLDEARRIAANIVKLPTLLSRGKVMAKPTQDQLRTSRWSFIHEDAMRKC